MLKKIIKLGRQKLWTTHRDLLIERHNSTYLFWEATLNCNFKCKHYGSNAGEKVFKEVISTQKIKDAFLDISKHYDAKSITIAVTGGEPLLRKDLFEVMKYARSLGFHWGMVSNGSLWTKDMVEKAIDSGMETIDISIDGIGEVHDEFRNTKNAYSNAINAIKLLAKAKFLKHLRISTTVHKKNINSLDELYEEFKDLGITGWRLIHVDPIGRGLCNEDILLSKKDFIKMLDFIKSKRNSKSPIDVSTSCAHFLGDDYEDEVRDNFFFCATGFQVGSILHNGDIFVCPNVPRRKEYIQGNILKDSFPEVWENKFKIFRDRNRLLNDKCKNCDHWEECLGGALHTYDRDSKEQRVCFISDEN